MYAFTLDRPASLADAVSATASGGQVLAGGQTLLPSMKMRLSQPGRLVDLGAVKELAGIEPNGNSVVIGAMTVAGVAVKMHINNIDSKWVASCADVKATFDSLEHAKGEFPKIVEHRILVAHKAEKLRKEIDRLQAELNAL